MSREYCEARFFKLHCGGDENTSLWQNAVEVLYRSSLIFFLTVTIAIACKFILRLIRRGFEVSFPNLILFTSTLAGAVECGRSLIQITGATKHFQPGLNEWLYSISFTLLFSVYFLLTSLWRELDAIKESLQPISTKRVIIFAFPFIFVLFGMNVATAIIAGARTSRDRVIWAYRIDNILWIGASLCSTTFLFRYIRSSLSGADVSKERAFRFELMIRGMVLFTILFIISKIVQAAIWGKILNFHHPAPFIVLIAYDYIYFGILLSLIQLIMKGGEETERGLKLQRIKPEAVVNMQQWTTEGASVRAIKKKKVGDSKVPKWTKAELALARELPVWKRPPKTFRDWFSFPHPVNEWDARIKSLVVCFMILLSIILDLTIDMPYIYIYICFGYLCRVLFGPKLNLEAWLTLFLIVPILPLDPVYVPGPAKRFAQLCGLGFSFTVVIIRFVFDLKEAAYWVASALFIASSLEAVFSICLGCVGFAMMILMGIIPEDTCHKCRMLFHTIKASDIDKKKKVESEYTEGDPTNDTSTGDNDEVVLTKNHK